MINFHGANKPAGEARTWPNEMTREGIYGLEHRRMEAWAAFNATFPFTRMLAGHADYTPVVFGERRRETYHRLVARDDLEDAAVVVVERGVRGAGEALEVSMRAGGGFIARFTRLKQPAACHDVNDGALCGPSEPPRSSET